MSTEPRKYAGIDIPEGMTRAAFKKVVKLRNMEADREEFMEKRRAKRRQARQTSVKKRPKFPKSQDSSGITVVLDCGFDNLMEDSERTSLAGQLTRCYSENRRCFRPVELVISNFNGKLKQRFDNDMHKTHESWSNIEFLEGEKQVDQNAVYLTGDAPEVLDELQPGHTYYIGGIVDRDRYTNLCLNKSQKMGIKAARLPINEHIKVSGRRVLTTNQAFELLLKWIELRDWKAAFEAAIPSRKLTTTGTKQKSSDGKNDNDNTNPETQNKPTEDQPTIVAPEAVSTEE